jgi:hypothetical protein
MTTNLIQTKSILAKLLAGEDINVIHQSGITTASFDLKSRTMYLPVWQDMDEYLYDLLVGHENGHALWTPEEGWHDAIDEHGRAFKSFMNVVEDVRIERLIKRKYPGIARSFARGYAHLYEQDFFGIKKVRDLSKLNLIDRINIHCKVGTHVHVPFTDEERDVLHEVQSTETFKQVLDLAYRIFERVKKEEQDKLNSMEDLTEELMKQFGGMDDEDFEMSEEDFEDMMNDFADEQDESGSTSGSDEDGEEGETESDDSVDDSTDGEEGENGENSESGEESDEESDGSANDSSDDSDDDSEESSSDDHLKGGEEGGTNESNDWDESDGSESGESEDDDEEEPESITDRTFRSREKELCVTNVEYHHFTLPEPILENIVVPCEAVVKQFFIAYDEANPSNYPIAKGCMKEFNDTNGKFINMLVKEFEMRKNASQYARQRQAKTGELDMNKLHLYKFSNDLFKKATIVPKGKSHGLIMYVDMSGSMYDVFGPTIEQALILATFCKKVGIPFDIYGFSDSNTNLHVMMRDGTLPDTFGLSNKFKLHGSEKLIIKDKGFHLRHLIGSDLNNTTYRKAMQMLAVVAYNYKRHSTTGKYALSYFHWGSAGFELGSTPFTQTTLASRKMIESFRNNNKLDIVNVIYLTDGQGGNCFTFAGVPSNYSYGDTDRKTHKIIMTDSKTKQKIEFTQRYGEQQSKVTDFVQNITGCKHIGYYICSMNECRSELKRYMMMHDQKEADAAQKSYKLNKFFAVPHLGYDKYFFIAMPKTNVSDEDYDLDADWNARRMATAFKKAQDSKKRNRMLINQFAEEIAA